ncbi:MAG: hypothetical protein KIH65_003165 [Candidatus Uhrbacteria bacterium]|nr:hypothetical protein [Candidatus Uhrbacteria bacterium]
MEPTYLALWLAPMAEDIRTQDRHLEALLRLLRIPDGQATPQERIQWMRKSFDDASSFGRVLVIKHVETDTIVGVALLVPMYTLISRRCGVVEDLTIEQALDAREQYRITSLLLRTLVEEARKIQMDKIFANPQREHELLICLELNFDMDEQSQRMYRNLQPAPSGQEP